MILETVCVGPMQVNCYILASAENSPAMLIDPGAQERKISQVLKKYKLKPELIVNTHGHYDHIGCDNKFGVPVYIHKLDLRYLKEPGLNLSGLYFLPFKVKSEIRELEDGQLIGLDGMQLKVIHLPGHTPGGIGLLMLKPENNIIFTGDTLFCRGIGRSDLAGGDESLLGKSIREKLFTLPDQMVILPGHGPASTIGEEKKDNPFL